MKFVWDLLSCVLVFFFETVDVFIWKLDRLLCAQTSLLNFHFNCCHLCVSSTRTFMLNYTGSDNILTQTLCQLSGGCKDSSTCHTASSTELRPRLHMTKRWRVTSSDPPTPSLAALSVQSQTPFLLIDLTQLPVVLQLHSSAPFLCYWYYSDLKCRLSLWASHLHFKSYSPLPQTLFSLEFPLNWS